jgi:mono/diheme cytochrome c family protein
MPRNKAWRMRVLRRIGCWLCVFVACSAAASLRSPARAESMHEQVEADWLRQAEAWSSRPAAAQGQRSSVPTWADAAGAVDGVKNGAYAFHTDREPNPWWQVDLGVPRPIARIVVYNRLDYPPGLHNADGLIVLTSDDARQWTQVYDNGGRHFGGVSGAPPLEVTFKPGRVRARFVRLQIPSQAPVWFHLDEVEIYGPEDPKKNIALRRPADQSSVSQWSTAKVGTERRLVLPPAPITADTIEHVIRRGDLLAADLRGNGVDTRPFQRELDEVAAGLKRLPADAAAEAHRQLYLKARRIVRRLAFSNPLLDFDKLLLCKRFTQDTYPDVCLNHMPWVSRPGGDICVVTLAGPDGEPQVRNVIGGQLGPGHVHGMDLWFDADRVVFGYAQAKTAEGPQDRSRPNNYHLRRTEEPTHIFEIGIDGRNLRQLTDSRQWSDLDPTYLPSGEIAFVSERCGCSLQCNEYDKDETSCNLYVMRPDGSNVRRLSVTKDGDYLPHCLDDGTIGYTRWEYQERGWANIQSIWFVRPDGTGADALFKQHLNNPWALEDVRSIPGTASGKLVCIAAGHHTLAAGPVVVITPSRGMNDPRSIRIVTPGVRPPEGGMSGTAVDEGGVDDRGGLYMTPCPLSEKYFLVSYSFSNQQGDPTGYAIYLIDVFGTKELLYRDREISCFIPVPLRPRPKPPVLPNVTDPTTPYALCSVSKVTYGVEGIEPQQARYLRIAQRLQWPYDNQYGGQRYTEKADPNNWTPVRVIGEVPIEPDGSAYFQVPVETAVYFQLLDENHMELRRMRSFISFQPGERRSCVGCHETREDAPADRTFPMAMRRDPSIPVPPPWGRRPISFLRDVQPIFDKHCVGCHGGLRPAGGLDFGGGLTAGLRGQSSPIVGYGYNRAFDTIISRGLVSWSPVQGDAGITPPLAFGSHRSKLVQVLREGACSRRAKLSREEWYRLVTWIDANAPYHDGFVNKRPEEPAYGLPNDQELLKNIAAVHARRCAACHKPQEVTRADWIDLKRPERSLLLVAPLSEKAGGTGKCSQPVYHDQNDPDYRQVRQLVEAAVRRAWRYPRRDLRALLTATDSPER